jgi:hypothetical protein
VEVGGGGRTRRHKTKRTQRRRSVTRR